MDCDNCSLLKEAKKEIKALKRSRDATSLVLEIVTGMAKNYRWKLIQQDMLLNDFDFDELLEKLRDWNAKGAAEADQDTITFTLNFP